MSICEHGKIGDYVVLCYDYDEFGVYPIVMDEYWCNSFDEALKLVIFSWDYPFEICRFGKFDEDSRTSYKCVARSKEFAMM